MSRLTILVIMSVFTELPSWAAELSALPNGLDAPARLRCEYLVDPLGIDETAPRLSWEMVDSRRGAVQTAYRILAADDPAKLSTGVGNLWDTGKVASDESIHIVYAGKPLRARMQVWWKVRVWDRDGKASPWSAVASWSMGLLEAGDWQAKWIGDPEPPPPATPPNNGFHANLSETPDAHKWVDIDLGRTVSINAVRLFPARPYNWFMDEPGFLFPVRFKILVSSDADFSGAVTVVDRTQEDLPSPGAEPQRYEFPAIKGRHVRLLVTRLRERNLGRFGLALAEMQVLSQETNVAESKKVTASDSQEQPEWSTRFLVDGELVSRGYLGMEPLAPPRLRKTFLVADRSAISRAVVYVTALGLYELRLNGTRVGDHDLAPEWTDYHKRVQYQTYDVTGLLRKGENVLGVQLADGWYAGRIGLTQIVPAGPPRAIYGRQPRLLLQLELQHAGGHTERITSDASWYATSAGPLRVADLLDGEVYDARRESPGWDRPGFDDSGWRPVGVFDHAGVRLVAQPNEPIRVTHEIVPVSVTQPRPGIYVFDMGQNFAGWCRLKVQGALGQTVTLRHAEVLNPDGTIYTDNLRTAGATDRYTLRGNGVEVYEPRFTYHGFRYVEVTGLTEPATPDLLSGRVVHSDARPVGEFECSDPLLNRLWQNIVWTQRANLHGLPTDCPQRDERLGWTGDILAFAQTGCFNLDMAALFHKWIPDLRDAQTADGRYPDFAPHPFDPNARFSGVAAWGDAGVFVPWCQYQNYGDRRLLEQHFESARRWVDWIHTNNPDLLWKSERNNDYGDWLNADTLELEGWPAEGAAMPKDVFATAFFARSTQIVSQMARVLGRQADAERYEALANEIRHSFNGAYVAEDGRIEGDTQAGYAIALSFDLLPREIQSAAARRMADCFAQNDGQISTGFHSTICLMNQLTRYGYLDEAYRLIGNRKMPSWGYAIDHGATTIWERWDGYVAGRGYQNPTMNSFSHYALGSVGEWMYRTVIGINPDSKVPAYKRFTLKPRPGGGLTWARGAYHSIHGRIACAWKIEGKRLSLDVTVPPNTSATLHLPTGNAQTTTESGRMLADSEGMEVVEVTEDCTVCELAAGCYSFGFDNRN